MSNLKWEAKIADKVELPIKGRPGGRTLCTDPQRGFDNRVRPRAFALTPPGRKSTGIRIPNPCDSLTCTDTFSHQLSFNTNTSCYHSWLLGRRSCPSWQVHVLPAQRSHSKPSLPTLPGIYSNHGRVNELQDGLSLPPQHHTQMLTRQTMRRSPIRSAR